MRVRSLRSSLEKEPWKSLESMEDFVEADFVQPVYLGSGIAPFRTLATIDAVVPWREGSLMDGEDPRLDDSPALARWWRAAEEKWEIHKSSDKLTLRERLNFHKGIEQQYPGTPHRVLYTKSGNQIAACRLDASPALIDHTLYWAAVGSEEEAHYLVAIFNSMPLHELVEPLMSEGLFGKRHIDKYVFQTPIPTFNPSASLHTELAALGRRAEVLAATVELDPAWGFQKVRGKIRTGLGDHGVAGEIDQAVAELFGIRPSACGLPPPVRAADFLGALSAAEKQARAGTKKARRRPTNRTTPVASAKKKRAVSTRRTR